MPNRAAVEKSIMVGLALGSRIAERSLFYRKNYFYPDSPKAYQISQYDEPLCLGGSLAVEGPDGTEVVRFVRAHLEEDAAKTIHAGGGSGRIAGSTGSVVDFNRCGTPLLEIVTEPDLSTPEAARRFLTLLKATIQAIGVSDCDMEKGSLRCDANVSLRRPGESELRPKAELKNMNSFRFLERGIEAELRRQAAIYESGGSISLQTLHYDPQHDELTVLRSKEEADDYRYFPEPDLVPMEPTAELIERLRSELPELPAARAARFVSEFGLSQYDAEVLNQTPATAAYFEEVAAARGRREGGGELGHGRALGLPERARSRHRGLPGAPTGAGAADRARRGRHARLGGREAGVRGARRRRGRWGSRTDRAGAGPRADRRPGRASHRRRRGRRRATRRRPRSSARASRHCSGSSSDR